MTKNWVIPKQNLRQIWIVSRKKMPLKQTPQLSQNRVDTSIFSSILFDLNFNPLFYLKYRWSHFIADLIWISDNEYQSPECKFGFSLSLKYVILEYHMQTLMPCEFRNLGCIRLQWNACNMDSFTNMIRIDFYNLEILKLINFLITNDKFWHSFPFTKQKVFNQKRNKWNWYHDLSIKHYKPLFNSFQPSDTVSYHKSLLTLVQVMHVQHQTINGTNVNETLRTKLQWNFNQN